MDAANVLDAPAAGATVANQARQRQIIRRLSEHFRAARDGALRDFIVSERSRVDGCFTVLDLGGRVDYWHRVGFDFLDHNRIDVVCVNYTEAELYENQSTHPRVTARTGDACNMSGDADHSFQMVHSNSVIEHVGSFASKRAFATEVRRLAPAYYIQSPYAWFPIDPHWPKFPMFHWLPMSVRQKLLRRYSLGWGGPCASIDHAMRDLEGTTLLDRSQMEALFPDCEMRKESFLGLTKSLIAARRSAP